MGPLSGIRIVELASVGPVPFAGMILSDLGADVLRLDRAAPDKFQDPLATRLLGRGRRSVAVDLKNESGRGLALDLITGADALMEGYRPGVMERLGLSPHACLKSNPRLVFARMTGWGQSGPLAEAAGHDINYIALGAALYPLGQCELPPVPPLNLVGDYGGGGMLLVIGILSALLEARQTGLGQVVDAAMIDGAALQMTVFHEMLAQGEWQEKRGSNRLDGAAPYYTTYETADNKFVAVGAIEPHFYAELLRRLGAEGDAELLDQSNEARWPQMKRRLAAIFKTRTRDEWCQLLEGTDACFAPVLKMSEARQHAHNRARQAYVDVGGIAQPAPAPRFSRTPAEVSRATPEVGEHTIAALVDWGIDVERVRTLCAAGVLRCAS